MVDETVVCGDESCIDVMLCALYLPLIVVETSVTVCVLGKLTV